MNFEEMVVAVVAISAVAGVLRVLFGGGGGRRAERMMREVSRMQMQPPQPDPETARLREDVRGLKERVAVLERLITDQSSSLDREFEKLKNMD